MPEVLTAFFGVGRFCEVTAYKNPSFDNSVSTAYFISVEPCNVHCLNAFIACLEIYSVSTETLQGVFAKYHEAPLCLPSVCNLSQTCFEIMFITI